MIFAIRCRRSVCQGCLLQGCHRYYRRCLYIQPYHLQFTRCHAQGAAYDVRVCKLFCCEHNLVKSALSVWPSCCLFICPLWHSRGSLSHCKARNWRADRVRFLTVAVCDVQAKAVTTFSNATTVPIVKSVATLPGYGTVSDFNATQRQRVCCSHAHILACRHSTLLALLMTSRAHAAPASKYKR